MCVVVVVVSRMVLQQNQRFSLMEEKYKSLQGKTSSLFNMEEEVLRVSQKVRLIHRPGAEGSIHPHDKHKQHKLAQQLVVHCLVVAFICTGLEKWRKD